MPYAFAGLGEHWSNIAKSPQNRQICRQPAPAHGYPWAVIGGRMMIDVRGGDVIGRNEIRYDASFTKCIVGYLGCD